MTFDRKLLFRNHLHQVAVRASQRLGFLRKVCPVLNCNGRLSVYKGFIRSTMEYDPQVWQGAARFNLAKLDRIQQRCMRSIGAGTMLPSLSVPRQVWGLCYLFKLHHISGPAQLTDMLPPAAPEPARSRTRHQHQLKHSHAFQLSNPLPATSPDILHRSFPFGLLTTWNALPSAILNSPPSKAALQCFKVAVKKYLLELKLVGLLSTCTPQSSILPDGLAHASFLLFQPSWCVLCARIPRHLVGGVHNAPPTQLR